MGRWDGGAHHDEDADGHVARGDERHPLVPQVAQGAAHLRKEQMPSGAIECHRMASDATGCDLMRSDAIGCDRMPRTPSDAIGRGRHGTDKGR